VRSAHSPYHTAQHPPAGSWWAAAKTCSTVWQPTAQLDTLPAQARAWQCQGSYNFFQVEPMPHTIPLSCRSGVFIKPLQECQQVLPRCRPATHSGLPVLMCQLLCRAPHTAACKPSHRAGSPACM
jgi:hypothetical protein